MWRILTKDKIYSVDGLNEEGQAMVAETEETAQSALAVGRLVVKVTFSLPDSKVWGSGRMSGSGGTRIGAGGRDWRPDQWHVDGTGCVARG